MKELNTLNVAIACDHAGYEMKEELKKYLEGKFMLLKDFGTNSSDSVDYPDMIHPMASAINRGEFDFGIAICGTGNGVSMTANKYPGVRAGLCWNTEITRLTRQHNDANVISLPARFISQAEAELLIDTFFATEFEGGRHVNRVNKISQLLK